VFATLSGNSASVEWGCAMRLATFALFLSAGPVALGQSAAPAPANPEQHWLTPPALADPGLADPGLAEPGRDFTKLPPQWHFDSALPLTTMVLPAPAPHRWDDAQIDPKIVVRPPQSSLGEQVPGTLVAQNLHPGLSALPIQESQAKGKPIPTTWPNLNIHNIPIVWPKAQIKPVESSATGSASQK
jgi:hypothetical protein